MLSVFFHDNTNDVTMDELRPIKMQDEDDELNAILSSNRDECSDDWSDEVPRARRTHKHEDEEGQDKFQTDAVQWSTSNGKIYIPTGTTVPNLEPGFYEINSHPNIGIYFERIPVKTEGLLEFPDANTSKVIEEIKNFWDREDLFREFNLTYKRGIMLWGPPGGGKSCTLQLVSRDVIQRGGIVIKFGHPSVFSAGLRKLREVQPTTPVVVLMEDIDSSISIYSETEVINILDGVDRMDKIVFMATTNYPEMLGDRIMNRPSRFDKRFKVGYPSADARRMFLEFLSKDHEISELDIDQWVVDTNLFSIAHLKELFVAVVVLGNNYNRALKTLKSMSEHINSGDDAGGNIGFVKRGEEEDGEQTDPDDQEENRVWGDRPVRKRRGSGLAVPEPAPVLSIFG